MSLTDEQRQQVEAGVVKQVLIFKYDPMWVLSLYLQLIELTPVETLEISLTIAKGIQSKIEQYPFKSLEATIEQLEQQLSSIKDE